MELSRPPAAAAVVEHVPIEPRESRQLRFGQLNAHNFFDTKDDPSKQDTVLTREQYRNHVSKLAHAIRDGLGSPDVITMQEVENIKVLKDLVKHSAIRDLGYEPILKEGTDPRGIDNAILYRPEAVTLKQTMQIDPQGVSAAGRDTRLFTRPPLVATFSINGREDAKRGVREFSVINVHFTSKLGGEAAAERRREQANVVARFAQGLQTVDPRAGVLVAGDFNMSRKEPEFAPLRQTVRGAALVNATASVPWWDRFTWRRGNQRVQLDHLLVSKNVAPHLHTVRIPHIATQIAKDAASDPVRAEGYSDHDPIVATFSE